MKTILLLLVLMLVIPSGSVLAATRRVMLEVQNMACAVCPITVKKAIEQVSGVRKVDIDYEGKTATIEFEDAVATAEQLNEATKNAGYPSSVQTKVK